MTSNEEFINELNGLTNRGNNNEIPYKNCFRLVLMGKSKTGKVTNILIYNFFHFSKTIFFKPVTISELAAESKI